MTIWYRQGTVSVENGSTSVTGALTGWLNQAKEGDVFHGPDGAQYEIAAAPESNTALVLATPYAGETESGAAYAIDRRSPQWTLASDLAVKVATLLGRITTLILTDGAPNDGIGNDGSIAFDPLAQKFYFKAGGEWDEGTDIQGLTGWSPIFGLVSDNERRILGLVDWTGGEGDKPAAGLYVGAGGLTETIGEAVDVRGDTGNAAWTAVEAVVADGDRRVRRIVDWIGGEGDKPATGQYLGATGWVDDIEDAVDERGAAGAGNGDVVGPGATVVPGEIAVFSDETGEEIEGAGVTIGAIASAIDDKMDAITAALALPEIDTDPATPEAGTKLLFASDDGKLYTKDSEGNVVQVGAGAGGSGGGIPASYDQLLTSIGMLAIQAAEVADFAQFPSQDRFADSFEDLTYVDVDGATNLDAGTPGVLAPTLDETQVTINSVTGGPSAQASAILIVDRTTALLNDVTVEKFGLYSANALSVTLKIVKRNSSNNYDVVVTQAVSHPGGGWHDVALSSPFVVPGAGTYYLGAFQPIGDLSWTASVSRSFAASNLTGNGVTITEDTGIAFPLRYSYTTSTANDLSVSTEPLPLSVEPRYMHGLLLVREVASATANTDFFLDFSRNDGEDYVAATLTLLREVTAAGGVTLKLYGTDAVDVTGHAFDTACRARMRTENNKNVEFHGLFVYGAEATDEDAGVSREYLAAPLTLYVREDGSDGNDGKADSAEGAFLTLQKAYDVIAATLDLGGQTVTVQIADGTYGGVNINQPWTGGGKVIFRGNNSTPSDVEIAAASDHCFDISSPLPGVLQILDLKMSTTTSGSCIAVNAPALVEYGNVDFGAAALYHVHANGSGVNVTGISGYTISGGALYHWVGTANAHIRDLLKTITLTGTPAFTGFAFGSRGAILAVNANTFSGDATGARYLIDNGGIIFTNGGGASYLPGDSAGSGGTTTGGGIYS